MPGIAVLPMSTRHTATLPQCYSATVPQYHSPTVPKCHNAKIPQCHSAKVPQCQSVTVPKCHGAKVPQCQSATVQSATVGENTRVSEWLHVNGAKFHQASFNLQCLVGFCQLQNYTYHNHQQWWKNVFLVAALVILILTHTMCKPIVAHSTQRLAAGMAILLSKCGREQTSWE